MYWYLQVLRKYADFSGRARRKEYWMFTLPNALVYITLYALSSIPNIGTIFNAIFIVYALAIFIPSLAVGVRRLHDINKSGWWILLVLIPIIGGIVIYIFALLNSDPNPNKWGVSPKYGENQ